MKGEGPPKQFFTNFAYMRKLKLFIYSIVISSLVISCKGGENNDAAKTDSLTNIVKKDSVQSEKKKNPFLIEPPDTAYTGDYIDKYENGNTKFRGFYRFGKRHGQWMAFYADGKLWSEAFYDKGIRQGASNTYYENGKLRYKGWYKNDLRDSVWVFYDETGKEVQKLKFKNDEEVK